MKQACRRCGKMNAVTPAALCPTCKRLVMKEARDKAYGRHLEKTYGITFEDYQLLMEASGGKCYVCGGRGGGKRLSVDHDHSKSGRESVRGLCCAKCNVWVLGRLAMNDPQKILDLAESAALYLEYPPAQDILGD